MGLQGMASPRKGSFFRARRKDSMSAAARNLPPLSGMGVLMGAMMGVKKGISDA